MNYFVSFYQLATSLECFDLPRIIVPPLKLDLLACRATASASEAGGKVIHWEVKIESLDGETERLYTYDTFRS